MGTRGWPVGFQELEILNDAHGAPYSSKSLFLGRYGFRISHKGDLVSTYSHLEEENESSKHRPTVARVDLDAIAFTVQ